MFAIKTCRLEGGEIVGHLPREISRPTKFLLDRGAKVTAQEHIIEDHFFSKVLKFLA